MRLGRTLSGIATVMCLSFASCTLPARAVIRNASGGAIMLWPLGVRPLPLRSGETTGPIIYSGYERQEALFERRGCLYTYSVPDYAALPKGLKGYSARVIVVIHADMTLHFHQRSKTGVEGPEIIAAGFPLRPTTFCGSNGGTD